MTVELRFIPCAEFELSIHEFVDGEISAVEAGDLVVHLELCDACRDAVELLRRQVRIHSESVEFEQMVDAFDKNAFLRRLHDRLVDTNLERLSDLFYELGKAYFMAGNDSKLQIYLHKKAVSIERARSDGRRLVKETSALAERAKASRRATTSIKRADELLKGRGKLRQTRPGRASGRTALDNARRFLEESLILRPEHTAARLFLCGYFARMDRTDESIAEYKKLLARDDVSDHHRALALQHLGNTYGMRREYAKSVECYEEILAGDLVGDDPRFFHVPLGLAMFLAKLGRFDGSTQVFGQLVERYPEKMEETRAILSRAVAFRRLLSERAAFQTELEDRYPMLFAG